MSQKLSIKPYNRNSVIDKNAADTVWLSLSGAIDEIFNKNASNLSFEELYRHAYNLVLYKHGDLLYNGVEQKIICYLDGLLKTISASSSENLLKTLTDTWNEHKTVMGMIKDILMYLDRTYVGQKHKLPVYNLSLKLFRENVVHNPHIRDRLRELLLSNVERDRQSQIIDKFVMKSLLQMLQEISTDGVDAYEEEFEVLFLSITSDFYRSESQEFLLNNTITDYINKVEVRIREEEYRSVQYLMKSTAPKLKQVVDTELIATHCKSMMDSNCLTGFIHMMRENKTSDLKRLYTILSRVPSTLDSLRDAFGEYTKSCGLSLISQEDSQNDPVLFVNELMSLKQKHEVIINTSFQGDKKASKKLKEAFDHFINKGNRCASNIAAYLDDWLKTGVKTSTEHEADAILEKVVSLFQHVTDKDLFENYYKQHLAKRLLNAKTTSDEAEKAVLAKLKAECGYQFTSKLEGMFKDMTMSKQVMDEFKSSEELFSSLPVELDVLILTTGYWPLSQSQPCVLPSEISVATNVFKSYYFQKNDGKKLTWLLNLGSAVLKASFPLGRRDLTVSTYQMCILMLFNSQKNLSLNDIRSHFENLPESELRRQILSLCTPKLPLLKKSSKTKNISNDDIFCVNEEFQSKYKQIKVPLITLKEPNQQDDAVRSTQIPAEVDEGRKILVDASIVRIMKTRKRLTHSELIAEVTRQLSNRFNAIPQFIKHRIESLIERDYIERDKADPRVYNYLA